MPNPSIHPDHVERIERECADARQRARAQACDRLRSTIAHWRRARPLTVARSTQAYDDEQVRLHTLMLAALVADGERAPMLAAMEAAADDLLGGS